MIPAPGVAPLGAGAQISVMRAAETALTPSPTWLARAPPAPSEAWHLTHGCTVGPPQGL